MVGEWRREGQLTEAERKAALARSIGGTAKMVEDEVTAARVVSSLFAAATGFDDDLKAAKVLKKVGGPIGPAASLAGATAGYRADRLAGMPADEAMIKNGGNGIRRAVQWRGDGDDGSA